jgi:hypothetical protein
MTTKRYTNAATWLIAMTITASACDTAKIQAEADKTIKKVEEKAAETNEKPETNTAELAMAAPGDFQDSSPSKEFQTLVLPKPECDIEEKALNLHQQVKVMPTFDGVSPWPGLLGFWINQKAGIYVKITNRYSTKTNELDGTSTRLAVITLTMVNLCTSEVIAKGEKSIKASKLPINQLNIRLEKGTLKQALNPEAVIARIGEPKSQKPINDLVGLTLRYQIEGADEKTTHEEPILLRNVLNLQF